MARKNVNRNATDQAIPAAQMAISEILSLTTGKSLDARRYISRFTYGKIMARRNLVMDAILSNKPKYACCQCAVPVYLVATTDKCFFWRHKIEDGSCPSVTRSPLSMDEINERKYRGLPEGSRHKKCKSLIEQCLNLDPHFSDVLVEKTWRGTRDPKTLKRPDVSATFGALKAVFEIQLSTTYLSVVAKRRLFYQSEGALLCWVFDSFDPDDKRMTEDDILFTNNSNVFVVDEETLAASKEAGEFILRVHYLTYHRGGDGVQAKWETRLCGFSELTIRLEQQEIFLFDSGAAELAVEEEVKAERVLKEEQRLEALRASDAEAASGEAELIAFKKDEFRIALLEAIKTDMAGVVPTERRPFWEFMTDRATKYGLSLENDFGPSFKLRMFVLALLSAQAGYAIVWKFPNLLGVANHVAQQGPFAFHLFIEMLKRSGHFSELDKLPLQSSWHAKRETVRQRFKSKDPDMLVPNNIADIVAFLFPELPPARTSFMLGDNKQII
jgi:Family of unknown function (DUF6035)